MLKGGLAGYSVASMNNDGKVEVAMIIPLRCGDMIQKVKSVTVRYELNN